MSRSPIPGTVDPGGVDTVVPLAPQRRACARSFRSQMRCVGHSSWSCCLNPRVLAGGGRPRDDQSIPDGFAVIVMRSDIGVQRSLRCNCSVAGGPRAVCGTRRKVCDGYLMHIRNVGRQENASIVTTYRWIESALAGPEITTFPGSPGPSPETSRSLSTETPADLRQRNLRHGPTSCSGRAGLPCGPVWHHPAQRRRDAE